MNVGIAVHRYAVNDGTGGYVAELIPRIAQVHRVTLYAARVITPVPAGIEVVRVPAIMRRAYAAVLTFPLGLRAVRRAHDLFHVQGWLTSTADVVTAHIVLAAWRQAARGAGVPSPWGERTLGPFVERREAGLMRRARRVIAPSAKVRDEIARCYGRTSGVHIVHHGFPGPSSVSAVPPLPGPEARRQLGLPQNGTIALFVGDPRKGLRVALDAVRQVPQVRLAVVTRSPRSAVMDQAEQAGIPDRVDWIGALQDVGPAYVAADFLLHPTIYDAFGLVVAEAMARGLPIVTTAAAGVAELVGHGESGWLVQGDVPGGTLAAVRALAQDPALRQRLGEGARRAATQRSWDDVARETLVVYEEALRS